MEPDAEHGALGLALWQADAAEWQERIAALVRREQFEREFGWEAPE